MIKHEQWPPPDWVEVIVTWKWIMTSYNHHPNELFNWVTAQPGGRWHLHGTGSKSDFSFRFENPQDATWFRMNLPE
jgi:hypothetical protein